MLLTVVYREACLQRLSWSSRVIENINTISSLMNHLSRTGVILDNAIDFSADGARIDIYDEASLRAHHLIIRDHGVGIPEYALGKIFERFYSLARPHTHKSTGLGLSFVREVMRKHGGEVEVANHPQGGVVVRLVLPKNT